MVRKCSHCGFMGHNSRTCCATYKGAANNGLIKLFGVQLDLHSSNSSSTSFIKKSFSLDCLSMAMGSSFSSSSPANSSSSSSTRILSGGNINGQMTNDKATINGYLSDGLFGRPQEMRKKGVAWTEEEHKSFLRGLEKQGKGDWRGISKNYVKTRTPTQVASHAQKHFLRQASLRNNNNFKRRSSLFDMSGEEIKMDDHRQVNKRRSSDKEAADEHAVSNNNNNQSKRQRQHQDHCSADLIDFITSSSTIERPSQYLCFNSILTSPPEPPPPPAATKTMTNVSDNNNGGAELKLELTLSMAAPETFGQDKPSPNSSFLLGQPIGVV